ncbi:polysaccharide deacetylase family protein [Nonomuraea sp. NPDC049695]|uniref:polysaccharide deacetylase family protein n=1 Tax=Nonomuraea sp. NPDC049695 TaxID=3154734 RepID=UPI0034130A12
MPGICIISIDTELAWGTNAEDLPALSRIFDDEPRIMRRLVDLFDAYHVPATWAVVGQMLVRQAEGNGRVRTPERWYEAPYLLDWLGGARVQHEIGTHTFTHVYAHDPATTREVWVRELTAAAEVSRQFGIPMRSIVYPRNQVAYLDTLPDFGIIAYRGVEQNWYGNRLGALHFLDRAIAVTAPTYAPHTLRTGEHFVNLPASQFLIGSNGPRKLIPYSSRVRQARLGLDQAGRRGEIYHLWFHPFNLGGDPRMLDTFERILRHIALRRDRGALTVMTMAQAADHILASADAPGASR